MSIKQTEALELNCSSQTESPATKSIAAIREALAEQPAQGCDFCSHPLYAGTKCKHCGQPAQQQEPDCALKRGGIVCRHCDLEIVEAAAELAGPLPSIEDFPPARNVNDVAAVHGNVWVCTDQRYESYTWSRFDQESSSILSVSANRYGMLGGRGSQVKLEKNNG